MIFLNFSLKMILANISLSLGGGVLSYTPAFLDIDIDYRYLTTSILFV
jgi:hypothetical protein